MAKSTAKKPGKALNAANLKALGAERLAALLLEVADDHPAAKRLVRLELAGAASAELFERTYDDYRARVAQVYS